MRAWLVAGHDPSPLTGLGSNTWLLEGALPTLIDTGSGRAEHLNDLEELLGQSGLPLGQVLLTHAHPDHIGGAALLAGRWPVARFARFSPPSDGADTAIAWQALSDDEIVVAGDDHLWVVHTPGHAPDHICFFEPRSRTLFGGDLVMNGGTVVIPATRGGDLTQYLSSLRRVLDLQPRRILAGHGEPIEQPGPLLKGYIAHRLGRERQVVDALRQSAATIPTLAQTVYPNLSPALRSPAYESLLAHLRKLEEEHRAVCGSEGPDPFSDVWQLTESS